MKSKIVSTQTSHQCACVTWYVMTSKDFLNRLLDADTRSKASVEAIADEVTEH